MAVIAGWVTTEVGRQPWTVFGLMRTADSVSPSLTGANVVLSFLGYVIVYMLIFPAGFIVMRRIVRQGPRDVPTEPIQAGKAAAPVVGLPIPTGAAE